MAFDLKKTINTAISGLSDRQKEIISERFGLLDGKEKTLQELGERHDITRERVRQIEAEGIRLARVAYLKNDGPQIVMVAKGHLDLLGGARNEDDLEKDMKHLLGNDSVNKQQIKFLFELAKEPLYYKEDENYNSFWYLEKAVLKKINAFTEKALKIFINKKDDLVFGGKFNAHFAQLVGTSNVSENTGLNFLSISKRFATNPYGDFGLADWDEINPRTARSKAYLILKKEGKPMHFREIAKSINEKTIDGKPVYAQTIHNELIKDNRFVLVGRGIYGLSEQGYYPGTAKDVIKSILSQKGPLHQDEIIQLVSTQRFLKDNTIMLNLQNKKYFKKTENGKYHLA